MTFAQLLKILVTGEEMEQAMSDPRNISLHPLLHLAAREALTSRDYIILNEEDSNQPYGVRSARLPCHWLQRCCLVATSHARAKAEKWAPVHLLTRTRFPNVEFQGEGQ